MSQRDWDIYFLEEAKLKSTRSKDPSTKCGAVIVEAGTRRIISTGYNGFPWCMPDLPEWYNDRTEKYARVVHCEINALIFAREPVTGHTLYTYPFTCCDRCLVVMAQAGIHRFVAPMPTEDALKRWGASLEKTRLYAKEMNLQLDEICESNKGAQ